ncbi:hypothetical protein [Pseudofrankia saprophytica]|nr:hypothetical protein [Pseudofrankia saprophytica]
MPERMARPLCTANATEPRGPRERAPVGLYAHGVVVANLDRRAGDPHEHSAATQAAVVRVRLVADG